MDKDIVLVIDYHDKNLEFRRWNQATGQEDCFNRANEREVLLKLLEGLAAQARAQGGELVPIMESTTGWARVKGLCLGYGELRLVNVLEMPLPAKARRKKSDKLDTGRLLREYRNGKLPLAFQPRPSLRRLRRLVGLHVNLVRRRTALSNWLNRYLAHETWSGRDRLWSKRGRVGLRLWVRGLPRMDRLVLDEKLDEIEGLQERIADVERHLQRVAHRWKAARKLDAIKGIGPVGAVAMAACIGPIGRFANADALVGYAGLAPGVRESDTTRRDGHIGGGGTDKLLRHHLVEASVWARRIPRYRPAYERLLKRRGPKVARLQVARMILRSIDALLREDREFEPQMTASKADRPLPSPPRGKPPGR